MLAMQAPNTFNEWDQVLKTANKGQGKFWSIVSPLISELQLPTLNEMCIE